MFVELHIIQNFPPSNLNRDDLGQPKDADFGGYRRARISSQCLKRSTRYAGRNAASDVQPLFERLTRVPLGQRTHYLVEELKVKLTGMGRSEAEATTVAIEFARVYSSKRGKMKDKKPEETAVLLFLSDAEIDELAGLLDELEWTKLLADIEAAKPKKGKTGDKEKADNKEEDDEKATAKSPLKKIADDFAKKNEGRSSAPDIALFGRMLADRPSTNIDAACQVAHAISTNSTSMRTPIDYYTAMDDLKSDPGAGFLDVAYFNSACFYRYARIDFNQLVKNLGGNHDLALRSVEAFLRASEAAIPSGKKNAFAQECRPSFMLAVVRSSESDGWSLVNAFQKPVDPRVEPDGDLVKGSVRRLEKRYEHLVGFYGHETVKAIAVALPDGAVETEDLNERFAGSAKNMNKWVETVTSALHSGG